MTQYGLDGYGWTVLGVRRAQRKAQRELHRYLLKKIWDSQKIIIT